MPSQHFSYRLPCYRRFTYGVGHVLNDLCASIWFSYLLLFFHCVIHFSNKMAGFVMLIGQVADAVATPLIGYESDKTNGCLGYTKRKSWHLLGTVCVAVSFPFIFAGCINCNNADDWAKFIYFAAFVVIFQIGWASTQISHLSLIPELTPNDNERVELNAIRYSFTVMSGLCVYGSVWWLLSGADGSDLNPTDLSQFRKLGLIMVGTGSIFSIIFHVGTKEPDSSFDNVLFQSLNRLERRQNCEMTSKHWLVLPQFYVMGFLYMCTRLAVNLSQIYLPMYVKESLLLPKQYIAVIPLVVFVSGFLTSFAMRPANAVIGKMLTYVIGCMLIGAACVWIWFLKTTPLWEIIVAAALLGAGTSIILITSLAMTSDLIGKNTASGAFVFGCMSFTDKLANGAAIMLVQVFHPCREVVCCADCVWYYRNTMAFTPSAACIGALLALLTIKILSKLKIGMHTFGNGVSQEESVRVAEYDPLCNSADEDCETDNADCCNYWCCLRTTVEAEARAIICSCKAEQCQHSVATVSSLESHENSLAPCISTTSHTQEDRRRSTESDSSLLSPSSIPRYGAIP